MHKQYDKKDGKRIIQQDGKTYKQNCFGEWIPETNWCGADKVRTNLFNKPIIKTDIFGQQKIETNWSGQPIVKAG